MKRIFLLLSLMFLLTSCFETTISKKDTQEKYHGVTISVVEFDSCEYVIFDGHRMAHKGNCKFCAERLNNKLKNLYINRTKKR